MPRKEQMILLEERKQIMVGMMQFFREFCQSHDLKCYLAAGTLLGAVRHHGYIPWDDDVDLMMPMEDYNRLIQLTKDEPCVGNYMISTMDNHPDHMWMMAKVIDKRTKLVEENAVRRHLEKVQERFYGVYLDVFPMYGLPDEAAAREKFQRKIDRTYTAYKHSMRIMTKRPQDGQVYFHWRRLLYDLYCMPFRARGHRYYMRKMARLTNRYALKYSSYFGVTCGIVKSGKDHFPSRYLGKETELPFEGHDFSVLAEYDGMLTAQYGDYMQLPPEKERQTHPSRASWR